MASVKLGEKITLLRQTIAWGNCDDSTISNQADCDVNTLLVIITEAYFGYMVIFIWRHRHVRVERGSSYRTLEKKAVKW